MDWFKRHSFAFVTMLLALLARALGGLLYLPAPFTLLLGLICTVGYTWGRMLRAYARAEERTDDPALQQRLQALCARYAIDGLTPAVVTGTGRGIIRRYPGHLLVSPKLAEVLGEDEFAAAIGYVLCWRERSRRATIARMMVRTAAGATLFAITMATVPVGGIWAWGVLLLAWIGYAVLTVCAPVNRRAIRESLLRFQQAGGDMYALLKGQVQGMANSQPGVFRWPDSAANTRVSLRISAELAGISPAELGEMLRSARVSKDVDPTAPSPVRGLMWVRLVYEVIYWALFQAFASNLLARLL